MRPQIRVTRPLFYSAPSCSGHTDLTGRQGEYIYGGNDDSTLNDMLKRAVEKFPGEPLDVEYNGNYEGRFFAKHPGTPDQEIVCLPRSEPGIEVSIVKYAADVFGGYVLSKTTSLGVDIALAKLQKVLGRTLTPEQRELCERY